MSQKMKAQMMRYQGLADPEKNEKDLSCEKSQRAEKKREKRRLDGEKDQICAKGLDPILHSIETTDFLIRKHNRLTAKSV
jgi:hypothetical protein